MKFFSTTFLIIFGLNLTFSQSIRYEDKIRIAEAINIVNTVGDEIWFKISETPFTLVLVSDDYEYLINHPEPTSDFKFLEFDSIINTNVFYRKAKFNKHFLATFPAVNGKNCIVVGTPENTDKSSSEWIITLLHEYFHVYTYNSKNYFSKVNDLGLSKGDTTGMWMINYDFPYTEKRILKHYNKYVKSIKNLVSNLDLNNLKKAIKKYNKSKSKFKSSLDPLDYKYFSFQVWQEGIARYTEIKFLELLKNYIPSKEILALKDFQPFKSLNNKMIQDELENLTKLKLNESKRICFYSVGMAEGLLLDKLNPNWKSLYLKNRFNIDKYSSYAETNK